MSGGGMTMRPLASRSSLAQVCAVARGQVRLELGQAGELERRQVAALQVLDDGRAVPREIRADEELLVLQADQGLRHAARAAQVRLGDERLGEAHAQP